MRYAFSLGIAALACLPWVSTYAGNVTIAPGITGQSDTTLRLAYGREWDNRWLQSQRGELGGYWDLGLTYWEEGDAAPDRYSISFSPVFVYRFNTDGFTPFIEAGIGAAAFSGTHVGDRDLGSRLAFEDRIGAGVEFAVHHVIGIRAMHYSNADLASPNEGIESYSLYYRYSF
ncbi:acyloxyacyl hydrolase [Halotalea alkalilenta]|uniref:acyloxyacyl hydrolase n=1 Tax=Halotalea alkalilenta TaxID=376489 RepID=UPI0004888BC1|nr:acyloxyacyl hydrolase [Halotalea alkalilenta]